MCVTSDEKKIIDSQVHIYAYILMASADYFVR